MSINVLDKLINLQMLFNRVISNPTHSGLTQEEIRIANLLRIQNCDTFLNNLDICANDIKKYIALIKTNCRNKL